MNSELNGLLEMYWPSWMRFVEIQKQRFKVKAEAHDILSEALMKLAENGGLLNCMESTDPGKHLYCCVRKAIEFTMMDIQKKECRRIVLGLNQVGQLIAESDTPGDDALQEDLIMHKRREIEAKCRPDNFISPNPCSATRIRSDVHTYLYNYTSYRKDQGAARRAYEASVTWIRDGKKHKVSLTSYLRDRCVAFMLTQAQRVSVMTE